MRNFQGFFKDVSRYVKKVSRVFEKSFKVVLRNIEGCLEGALRVCLGSPSGLSIKFQSCLRKFQGFFNGVPSKF